MKNKKVQELRKVFPSGMEGKEYEKIIAFIENLAESPHGKSMLLYLLPLDRGDSGDIRRYTRRNVILTILRCIATDVGINESTKTIDKLI